MYTVGAIHETSFIGSRNCPYTRKETGFGNLKIMT